MLCVLTASSVDWAVWWAPCYKEGAIIFLLSEEAQALGVYVAYECAWWEG